LYSILRKTLLLLGNLAGRNGVSKKSSCHCIANNALDRGLMVRRRFPVAKIEDSSSSGVEFLSFLPFLHDSLLPDSLLLLRPIQPDQSLGYTRAPSLFDTTLDNSHWPFQKTPPITVIRSIHPVTFCFGEPCFSNVSRSYQYASNVLYCVLRITISCHFL
jgi:hypothetical protein